jgi:predicted RNase H-like nuclease (RuvC/YqgF family)
MKRCAVCEVEIRSSLEEFGDPREPLCAHCYLSDEQPGNKEEDEIDELESEIGRLRECIKECLSDIEYTERQISDYESEIRELEKKREEKAKVMVPKVTSTHYSASLV